MIEEVDFFKYEVFKDGLHPRIKRNGIEKAGAFLMPLFI